MNPQELHGLLVQDIQSVVSNLLPNGKKIGKEWVIGSVNGEKGKSMSVCLEGHKAGVWSDFATGDSGNLLHLWGRVHNKDFVGVLDDVRNYLGVEAPPKFKSKKYKLPKKPKCKKPNDEFFAWLKARGIEKKTIELLKVGRQNNNLVFPYLSPDGVLELIKYRDIKEKKFWSNEEPIPCLFGWQAVQNNHQDIVICEGEIDCLTFWQQGIPALSVPKGAGSGEKQSWIEYEYDRLERFDNVYICMDSDKAGREAVTEIIDRLGRHRCKVVSQKYGDHEYKDPNEAHLDGVNLEVFLKTAKTVDPEELKKLAEFHDEIMKELDPQLKEGEGVKLPWQKSFSDIRLRPSEVSVWAGVNGHGKSALISQIMVDGVSQGTKWCVASMEMPAHKFGAKVYQQVGGVSYPSKDHASKIRQFIDNNIYVFTAYGTTKAGRILSVFEYARKRYGVKHFVIDSLAKCGFAEDDAVHQKEFVDTLFEYALQNGVHVHLVVHVRKGDTEEKQPGKYDIKGTGAITDMVSNVFIVWRNKIKERLMGGSEAEQEKAKDMVDATLDCVKQRETGIEPKYGLWFNTKSNQFLERSGATPKQYIY